MGDPAGIGPEIIVRLFAEGFRCDGVAPFVVGEVRHLEQAAACLGIHLVSRTEPVSPGVFTTLNFSGFSIPVQEPPDFHFDGPLEQGQISAQCGAAAWAYIRHAVHLVQAGQADGIVTAPLQKEALQAAGCPYPGHTEMLAALAGDAKVAMLLVGGGLRVALATIHEPVARVPGLLTRDGILENLRLMDSFIPWFGVERPVRIGVTGLNPHAGEGGMFGDEERDIIIPAIEAARAEGIHAIGPQPADTIFYFHREGAYDAVLAMYHDQALIPVKTLAFHDGVNVTMGLPFIRTSVDHGTAFDIAGKGIARPDSLRAALHCAATLVKNKS